MVRKLAFLLPLLLVGCGGGGSSSSAPARGTATINIAWPTDDAASRFVPLSAGAVVVTLSKGTFSVSKTVVRPAASANFDSLAYTDYSVAVTAYPTVSAGVVSGVAQAVGNAQMTVAEDMPGSVNVSLATTVNSIAILPLQLDKKAKADAKITALDVNGNLVLLSTSTGNEAATWVTDAPSIASVTGTGPTATVQGLHSGSTTVRATLSLGTTSLSASAPVTINVINDGTGTVNVS